MAGITMYLQLPFNLIRTKVKLISIAASGLGQGGGLVSTPGIFS